MNLCEVFSLSGNLIDFGKDQTVNFVGWCGGLLTASFPTGGSLSSLGQTRMLSNCTTQVG